MSVTWQIYYSNQIVCINGHTFWINSKIITIIFFIRKQNYKLLILSNHSIISNNFIAFSVIITRGRITH